MPVARRLAEPRDIKESPPACGAVIANAGIAIVLAQLRESMTMASVTVRKLPASTHRALKRRAAQHGRSTEAEIRLILEAAVRPGKGLGSALAEIGRRVGGVALKIARDHTPVSPRSRRGGGATG
jgi:plasmid stability protein